MQYIVSCLWFPFSMVMSTDSIHVGWWEITSVGTGNSKVLSEAVFTRNLVFAVPKHPQAAQRGEYLNMQPFSRYMVNAGPWGSIPIDNIQLIGEDTVTFVMNVDLYTGTGRLSLKAKNVLAYVEDHTAQIGVPIQLGQNLLNQGALCNAATSGVGTVTNALL